MKPLQKKDFVAAVRANAAWPDGPPDWLVVLAERCTEESQSAVARRFGVSGSMLSQILAGTYPADTSRIEDMVRGAYMGASVQCGGLGRAIGIDRCRSEQARKFSSASPLATLMARACASCPHNASAGSREAKP